LVTGLFSPLRGSSEQGILLFLDGSGRAAASFLALSRDPQRNSEVTVRDVFDPVAGGWPVLPEQTVAQALDETFEIRPTDARALFIGDVVLIPAN
jgi:hypothetical protein